MKYNKLKIFFDVITFKLKYKDIQKVQELYELYTEIFIDKYPISFRHLKTITKYDLGDIKKLIDFHNRYVKNKNDRIDIQDFLPIISKIVLSNVRLVPQLNPFVNQILDRFEDGTLKRMKFD